MIKYLRWCVQSAYYDFIIATSEKCYVHERDRDKWHLMFYANNNLYAEPHSEGRPATPQDLHNEWWKESSELEVLVVCGPSFLELIKEGDNHV